MLRHWARCSCEARQSDGVLRNGNSNDNCNSWPRMTRKTARTSPDRSVVVQGSGAGPQEASSGLEAVRRSVRARRHPRVFRGIRVCSSAAALLPLIFR
jgi:hypothetical protein